MNTFLKWASAFVIAIFATAGLMVLLVGWVLAFRTG